MLEDNLGGEVGVWCIKRVQFLRDMFQWLSPVVATRDKHSLFSLWPDCLAFMYVTFNSIQFNSNLYFDTVKNSSGFGTIYNYITIINNNKYVSKKSYL